MIRLHNLQTRPGSRHRVKRLGCGESSGHGKTSGKGHKGQKARSGGSIRLGFEGGQMPLIRRLPKRGFNNAAFHKNYAIVNLEDLTGFKEGAVINEQVLRESRLIRGRAIGVKVLGGGELKHKLTIEVDKVSASAREKIEKAGGTVTLREKAGERSSSATETKTDSEGKKETESVAATKKTAPKKKTTAKAKPKKKPNNKS
jgi:large subunit ribosomal protein L15